MSKYVCYTSAYVYDKKVDAVVRLVNSIRERAKSLNRSITTEEYEEMIKAYAGIGNLSTADEIASILVKRSLTSEEVEQILSEAIKLGRYDDACNAAKLLDHTLTVQELERILDFNTGFNKPGFMSIHEILRITKRIGRAMNSDELEHMLIKYVHIGYLEESEKIAVILNRPLNDYERSRCLKVRKEVCSV